MLIIGSHAAQGVRMDGWAFYAEEVEVIPNVD